MNALFTACFFSIQAAPSQLFVFRLQRYKIFLIFTVFICVILCAFMRFYALLRSIGVVVRDCVGDCVRDCVRGK